LDGEIYDYDPDTYNAERIQRYLQNRPRAIRFARDDSYFIEDKVLRCMNSLPQFKLSPSIMLSNLRIRID
jgi:hypothetical protein